MHTRSLFTIVVLAGLSLLKANAATVVSDNFDSYANQAAFEAVWVPIASGSPSSAELSTLQASSLANSVRVPGTTLNNLYRNRRTFAETGALVANLTLITWSFDFYDGPGSGNPQRNYANLQDTTAPSGTGQLISMGLNNNQLGTASGGNYYMARILGYTVPLTADPDGGPAETVSAASSYFKLNDFGVGLRSAGWHNLKVEISSDNNLSMDFAFYVDNVLAERVSNVGSVSAFRSYDNITIGAGVGNGNTEAFFDNVVLSTTVPEPGAIAFAAMGFGALLFFRKLRR